MAPLPMGFSRQEYWSGLPGCDKLWDHWLLQETSRHVIFNVSLALKVSNVIHFSDSFQPFAYLLVFFFFGWGAILLKFRELPLFTISDEPMENRTFGI